MGKRHGVRPGTYNNSKNKHRKKFKFKKHTGKQIGMGRETPHISGRQLAYQQVADEKKQNTLGGNSRKAKQTKRSAPAVQSR